VYLVAEGDGKELFRMKKMVVAPGEMEHVDIPYTVLNGLSGDITIKIVK
jgi:hypothetical protein